MINKDGAPSLTKGGKQRYSHHHVLGVDCDRNADTALDFYWRAHDRCHWSNSLVPLKERRRRGFTELPPPMTSAPPFEALAGAWEDALGNSVELIRRGA
jgi:hypothetical protein